MRPTAVNAVLAEVRELQSRGADLVSLMRGEPDFSTPAHVTEAAERALRNGRTNYPDNRGERNFREAIALKLERDNSLRYDPATEIIATTGATFGIQAALTALLNEGDEVLLPDPVYDAYQSPIHLAGGVIRRVPSCVENGRFTLNTSALEKLHSARTKLLVLNTPWNPVGSVLRRDEIDHIADFCLSRNVVLLSDEIYEAITYGDARHVSPFAARPDLRDRYIHINSLSKTYAMTGWRAGYCAGPRGIIDAIFMVLAQSSRGPATFIQDAAAAALSGPQDCVSAMRTEYARRRDQVIEALNGLPRVRVLAPEGGFFAMADVRDLGEPSDSIRKKLLGDHGVVVIHGSAYGPVGEGTLRVSFASGGANLARGLERLRQGLA